MGRLGHFVIGLMVGGVLVFTALKYHVVRAEDGFHLIPKLTAEFSQAYVDIRPFDLDDWAEHQTLAIAISRAGRSDLLQDAALVSLRGAVERVFKLPPAGRNTVQ